MPAKRKISKEDILEATLKIVRKEGIDNLNARKLAKMLGCSTQPLFYVYSNMEEIKEATLKEITRLFNEKMMTSHFGKVVYKDIGINYIQFAKENPQYFKILFQGEDCLGAFDFMNLKGSSKEIFHTISKQTGLNERQSQQFHLKMWLFVNGIANLVANKTVEFSDEEIDYLLADQYLSMILLEVKKGHVDQEVLTRMKNEKLERKDNDE